MYKWHQVYSALAEQVVTMSEILALISEKKADDIASSEEVYKKLYDLTQEVEDVWMMVEEE